MNRFRWLEGWVSLKVFGPRIGDHYRYKDISHKTLFTVCRVTDSRVWHKRTNPDWDEANNYEYDDSIEDFERFYEQV